MPACDNAGGRSVAGASARRPRLSRVNLMEFLAAAAALLAMAPSMAAATPPRCLRRGAREPH